MTTLTHLITLSVNTHRLGAMYQEQCLVVHCLVIQGSRQKETTCAHVYTYQISLHILNPEENVKISTVETMIIQKKPRTAQSVCMSCSTFKNLTRAGCGTQGAGWPWTDRKPQCQSFQMLHSNIYLDYQVFGAPLYFASHCLSITLIEALGLYMNYHIEYNKVSVLKELKL